MTLPGVGHVKSVYLDAIQMIERLHRQFLEVVRSELDALAIVDINNVQALILSNIGREQITVGELTNRGYYLGSNVSYNVKKMVENGYLEQERSPHDRRTVRLKVSAKGLALCDQVTAMFDRHVAALSRAASGEKVLTEVNDGLRVLERFWTDMLRLGPTRAAELTSAA